MATCCGQVRTRLTRAHLSLLQDGRRKVVVMTPAYPERFRSLLGGTGHWPVLPGDPPGRRAHEAATEWWVAAARTTGRQVAAQNGQVGRSTHTDDLFPAYTPWQNTEMRPLHPNC
jgi:hypothetical protein